MIWHYFVDDKKSKFIAPDRNNSFTGRVAVLEMLRKILSSFPKSADSGKRVGFKLAALSGLGGTGKTSIAVEYAWKNAEYYSGGCYWISIDNLEDSIQNIASTILDCNVDTTSSVKDKLRSVLCYLSSISRPLLVVIDNMDSLNVPTLLEIILFGPWKQQPGFRSLLVTSRCSSAVLNEILHIGDEQSIITVGCFEEVESITFLERRTMKVREVIEFSATLASELSRKVGHLPLALEQAASYLSFTRCLLQNYITAYKKQRSKLLKRSKASNHPSSDKSAAALRLAVHTTWKMNFDCIQKEEPFGKVAYSFVRTAAFFASEKIPFQLIKVMDEDTFRSDPTALRATVSHLTELSLFREDLKKCLSVHRLVQEVVQESVSDVVDTLKETLQLAARSLVTCLKKYRPPNVTEYAMWGKAGKLEHWGILASHALVLQKHLLSRADLLHDQFSDNVYTTNVAVLVHNASIYASVIGRQSMAKELDCQKLRILVVKDHSLCDQDVADLTSVTIPLPVKVQQNLRREVGDTTMTGTKQLKDVLLKNRRKRGRLPASSGSLKIDVDDEVRTKWMDTVQACKHNVLEAGEVVDRLTELLSTCLPTSSRETACKRFAILSCRARAHIHSGMPYAAVKDAKECIKLCPGQSDGYEILAQIFSLIKCSSVPLARCMAAVAKHFKAKSSTAPWFRLDYPDAHSVEVKTQMELESILSNQKSYRGATILMDDFSVVRNELSFSKDINFVGIGTCKVSLREGMSFEGFNSCWINVNINMESKCIDVSGNSSLCFLHCQVQSCGSIATVIVNGSAYADSCSFVGSASIGIHTRGPSSMSTVMSCFVKGNKCGGLTAAEGGSLLAVNNTICENGYGILLGPLPGQCLLQQNVIFMNERAGVVATHYDKAIKELLAEKEITGTFHSIRFQKIWILVEENEICENGTYGVAFSLLLSKFGTVALKNNLINGNAIWGLSSISESDSSDEVSVLVSGNAFRNNKCGDLKIVGKGHKVDGNVIEHNPIAFSNSAPLNDCTRNNTIVNNETTIYYPKSEPLWHDDRCCQCNCHIRRQEKGIWCFKCNAAVYCSKKCLDIHFSTHERVCSFIRSRYSATAQLNAVPLSDLKEGKRFRIRIPINKRHKIGPAFALQPEVGFPRFVVKLQTKENSFSANDPIEVYDRSETISTWIESSELYHVLVNCGAMTEFQGTSKKAYCWAVLEDKETVRIFFNQLAPYAEDW
jgi:hypothetical protein